MGEVVIVGQDNNGQPVGILGLGNYQIVGDSHFAETEDPEQAPEDRSVDDNRSYRSRGIFSTQSMAQYPLKFGQSLKTINFEVLSEERSEHSSEDCLPEGEREKFETQSVDEKMQTSDSKLA